MKTKLINLLKSGFISNILLFVIIVLCFNAIINNHLAGISSSTIYMVKDFINGDFFLDNWNISYNETNILNLFYYFIPFKLFGITAKSVLIAVCIMFFASFLTASLIINPDIKKNSINNIIIMLLFIGIGSKTILDIGRYGIFLPFLFLCLFFVDQYLKTEKIKYLIFYTIISMFWVFCDSISILLLIIPLLLYSAVKIFYSNKIKKYLRIFLLTLFSLLMGLLFFIIYSKFHPNTDLFFNSQAFINYYQENDALFNRFDDIFVKCLDIQDANILDTFVVSKSTVFYFYRLIITIAGIVLSCKIFFNTLFRRKYKTDFISFALSCGLLLILMFFFYINYDVYAYLYYAFTILPFAISIIIIRYKDWLNKLNPVQYQMLLIMSFIIVFFFGLNI